MYDKPFYITEPVSNNAFNFERRTGKQLFVPALIEGDLKDVQPGTEIVFEDFDDQDVLQSCKGLSSFVKTEWNGKPVYIFDNHNHAFAYWHLEWIRGRIDAGALLVHMDMHKDSREPTEYLSGFQFSSENPGKPMVTKQNEEVIFQYTNTVLNVGNFVSAAAETGLVGEVINLDSEAALGGFVAQKNDDLAVPAGNTIFDLDLDIFAPDMNYIDKYLKMKVIKKAVEKSSMITIATSPFFIKQGLALKRLHQIFDFLK